MFTDHAVLQRGMAVPVWGWAIAGERVRVSIAEQTKDTIADKDGKWGVNLDPLKSGGPHNLIVEGDNRLELSDVLVGEVWLCSGQLNMEFGLAGSCDADLEVPAVDHPNIRLITCHSEGSQTPVEDFDGHWKICSLAKAVPFSAVAYYFGRELERQKHIPFGLIHNSWGGSTCEAWIRRDKLEGNPLYERTLAIYDRNHRPW